MSRPPQNDSEQHDIALARALADALKQRAPAAPVLSAHPSLESECPDAEVLAAYAEHNLDGRQTARWESHFAACTRCRTVLTVLAASDEVPLAPQEVRQFGEKVAAATLPGTGASKEARPPARFPARWRWLAPAIGVAAGAAFFFALRPAPRVARPVPESAMTRAEARASNEPQQMAQANIPPTPPGSGQAVTRPSPNARTGFTPQQAQSESAIDKASPNAKEPEVGDRVTTAKDSSAARVKKFAPGGVAETRNQAPAVEAQAPAPPVFSDSAGTSSSPRAKPSSPAAAASRPAAGNQIVVLAMKTTPVFFASPTGKSRWRIGAGGSIERSIDEGRTWQPQPSGVQTGLLAGAAPSEQEAWVVGRANIILRTTDGIHWQRLSGPGGAAANGQSSPGPAAPDWVAITATDALHATIVAGDSRRFTTADGGVTWVPQ
jgi:hypothetical protein